MFSSLAALFLSAFFAATLVVPIQSEIVFVALQAAGTAPLWLLVTVASVANTLGSFVNYVIGRQAHRLEGRSWYPASSTAMARAKMWFRRWGVWALLLSWAPFGDIITVLAGVLRTPLWQFTLLVAMAKTGRFIVLGWITAEALTQIAG